jgi:hypothetical protein
VQFSLKHLLAATASAAFGCIALVYASPTWGAITFTLAISLLLASLVLSYTGSALRRPFWIGFAVFGWGYWAVLHSPILDMEPDFNNWRLQGQGPRLISTSLLDWVYFRGLPLVHAEPQFDLNGRVTNNSRYPRGPDFMRVGHSIFAVLYAALGGLVGAVSYRWSHGRPEQASGG